MLSPMIGKTAQEFDLKPVIFTSKIIALRYQQKRLPLVMAALLFVRGYAGGDCGDGVWRWISLVFASGGVVLIDGIECPLAGRVSMDF